MNESSSASLEAASPFSALRQFARSRPAAERCELCAATLGSRHQHLLEPANRRLVCACTACAALFDGDRGDTQRRFRPVPRDAYFLPNFQLTEAQWEALLIPIDVAFLVTNSSAGRVIALYPSPAGATEAQPATEAWEELVEANPVLLTFLPDVEALLVNRRGALREYYCAPIDECFRLTGLVRLHWRGLSGGVQVWTEIARFFEELKERSRTASARGEPSHA